MTDNELLLGKTYPPDHPNVDEVITDYAKNNINIVLNLGVGNKNPGDVTRFRNKETLERYTNYFRYMVGHFKDSVRYFELWNEPVNTSEDYISLVKYVIPIIRNEYPDAKIIIGALSGGHVAGYPGYGDSMRFSMDGVYIKRFIGPDLAPIIDGISWHGLSNNLPNDPYYQNYPQMIEEIQAFAASNGFKGEYFLEELSWVTWDTELVKGNLFSESEALKLYARAIIMNRRLNVNVNVHVNTNGLLEMISNINTVIAGAKPANLRFKIESDAKNINSYSFLLPEGDMVVALWTNGAFNDNPEKATLTLPGLSTYKVVGIDVLYGFEQELAISADDGSLVIDNLLVRDYPILLRITR
ncbi:MAG: hypothetical protein Q7J78_01410 [Clostridiales bacterium]|nr:hypothetical protein [Clostridiales bacterium]